ncbi:MAG: DUF3343 domain-containing protein [Tissierellia bacterium]|nr:DUF3343 domain-containing protein [Tissierellia bacterium]
MELYIITFKHGDYAIAAFRRLESLNIINIKLSSVPFSIKSECDLCIKTSDVETLKTILRECKGKYHINNVYSAFKVNGIYSYKLLPLSVE